MTSRFPFPVSLLAGACIALAFTGSRVTAQDLVVFNAGSLARPLRAAADSFAVHEKTTTVFESAGSLETVRKLTELGKTPDIIALADDEAFPRLLMPRYATWFAKFATNRMVIAYTSRSRFANEITERNWTSVLLRPGVETGRSDPDLDPNGYRALMVMQLAESWYRVPGLDSQLLAASPKRNVRPKSSDLVALLQAGEFDYIWAYESVAQDAQFSYLRLPKQIDLGDLNDAPGYALANVCIKGRTPSDSVVLRGAPIRFALSIPLKAPHAAAAARFIAYLFSAEGQRVLHRERLNVLDQPVITGTGAPDAIARRASP